MLPAQPPRPCSRPTFYANLRTKSPCCGLLLRPISNRRSLCFFPPANRWNTCLMLSVECVQVSAFWRFMARSTSSKGWTFMSHFDRKIMQFCLPPISPPEDWVSNFEWNFKFFLSNDEISTDFPDVNWVVHMDCPEDVNTYIHRSGRTARLENGGNSLLVLLPNEEKFIDQLKEKKIPITQIKWENFI